MKCKKRENPLEIVVGNCTGCGIFSTTFNSKEIIDLITKDAINNGVTISKGVCEGNNIEIWLFPNKIVQKNFRKYWKEKIILDKQTKQNAKK